jgi:2-polyprenyl-3-methyl-5-hydroxy-6-metoxy-1,4-benzoquinol methylase
LAVRQISDAGDLPFDDASFGFILCMEVFEHLFDTERAAAEIKRVLAPGGYAVIQVPNVAHWRHRADMALRGRFVAGGDMETLSRPWHDPHIRFFTTSSLPALARHVGLEVVDVHGVCSNGLKHLPVLRDRIRHQRAGPIAGRLVALWPGLFGERVRIIVRRGAG